MIKIIWSNIKGQKGILDSNGYSKFQTMQECEDYIKDRQPFGKPARWLPDFLEGAETRSVTIKESTETEEAEYILEYLHPAEYTYEIIEESLEVVKARKLAELSAISKQKNPYLDLQNLGYRMMNIQSGKYSKEGKQAKADAYLADYNAISDSLANEYLRCENLVNNAATEQEILAVTFNL